MTILHTSMLVVAALALIGIIFSFLGMTGIIGGRVAGAEDYDNPHIFYFCISLAVLVVDAALFGVLFLWDMDPSHITAIAVGGLLLSITATFLHRLGFTPASWWTKLVAPAGAPATKPWWMSKTMLINSAIAGLLLAEANITSLQGVLPASKYQLVAFGLPIINMLLRAYTSKGLSLKSNVPPAGASQ